MKQLVTEAIILTRTDYGEADRILTVLTPEYGKLRLLAKGVRRIKSKLAGGIELFSVSTITFVRGRGDIGTLVSTRLIKHYGHIVEDLDRTMLGYELIRQLNKMTEDEPGEEYFELLKQVFEALDTAVVPIPTIQLWFAAQLLQLDGHIPNLQTDAAGHKLSAEESYTFDMGSMCFQAQGGGRFTASTIKFLRLAFSYSPKVLAAVEGSAELVSVCGPLMNQMARQYLL